jgi:uncharacterized protein
MRPITVTGLFLYPLKSARGVEVQEVSVTDRGFAHDRRFMIVDSAGEFLTQRSHPSLCLVEVEIRGDVLVIAAPGAGRLEVPLVPTAGERRAVSVWGDAVAALSLGRDAAAFFERFLGAPCELVYMPDTSMRPVDPDRPERGDHVSFADRYPVLVISEASLADLNRRLETPLPMDRFRPNLVVSGCDPFAEDAWGEVAIGEVVFHAAKPCGRCVITTVDQRTGARGKEPLATLATFRKQGGEVVFGQNLLLRGRGVLRAGDRVLPPAWVGTPRSQVPPLG